MGGEESGHIICLDKTTTGDGIITALQVLDSLHNAAQPLHEICAEMQKTPQLALNIAADYPDRIVQHSEVQHAIEKVEQQLSGWGRIIVRASGTEPVVRVLLQGQDEARLHKCSELLVGVINQVCAYDALS